MARTISEIYDEIMTEKQNMSELAALQPAADTSQTLLEDLTSTSKVAIWRLWAWLTSVAIWIHEKLWDAFKAEVDAIVDAAIPGTARWYREMCLNFQYGDELVYLNNKYQYNPVDTDNCIIARASATESGGNVVLKVAKLVDGSPEKLSNDEAAAFAEYIDKIKFAGTFCQIISYDPDLINIEMEVYYDSTLLNSDGELLSDPSVKPVEAALEAYLSDLPWNGAVMLSSLVDAVQGATGVVDVVLESVEAKSAVAIGFTTVTRVYSTVAGYIVQDDPPQITYISV